MNPALHSVVNIVALYFREPYASLLAGVTYGIPIHITPQLSEQIRRSGLSHLVVLSGANITALLFLAEQLYSSVGKYTGIVLYCLFVGGFMAVVGLQPPLVRAGIMFACTATCMLTGRPVHAWWNLWLSVVFIALFRSDWIYTRSFQLSVAATAALIVGRRALSPIKQYLFPFLFDCLLSLSVFIGTLPLTIVYFRSISLVSPFATVFAGAIITPIMVCGLALPLFHFIFPPLAYVIAYLTSFLLSLLHRIIETAARIPYGYYSW